MDVPELRPLGVGELVDVAIKIWRRHFGALARVVLVVVAPLEVLAGLAVASGTGDGGAEAGSISESAGLVGTGLRMVATLFASAAALRVVTVAYLGGEPDWRESLKAAAARLPSVLWLMILTVAGLLAALVALVLPAIYLSVAWSLAFAASMAEGLRGRAALGRSYRLVRGRWWPTFGTLLLAWILVWVMAFLIQVPFMLALIAMEQGTLAFFVISVVAGTLSAVVTTPFLATVFILLYFDLRVRKEGFDLELLAGAVGEAPPLLGSDESEPPS